MSEGTDNESYMLGVEAGMFRGKLRLNEGQPFSAAIHSENKAFIQNMIEADGAYALFDPVEQDGVWLTVSVSWSPPQSKPKLRVVK